MDSKIPERKPANLAALLTKEELADHWKVTTRTIENFQARGLPFYRLGPRRNRYSLEAVTVWMDRHCRVTVVGGGAS